MPRLVLDEGIKSLSEFRVNVTSYISQVRRTKRPVVITHHGKPVAVLLDVSGYEVLMRRKEVLKDIHLPEKQLDQGRALAQETALRKALVRVIR